MQSMSDWNRDVITSFPISIQYIERYNQSYGWVERLKELAFLADLFCEIDKDGSGEVDKEEFSIFASHPTTKKIFSERFGFQPHQKDKLFTSISAGEGVITYERWMSYLYHLMKSTEAGMEADTRKRKTSRLGDWRCMVDED